MMGILSCLRETELNLTEFEPTFGSCAIFWEIAHLQCFKQPHPVANICVGGYKDLAVG